MSIDIDRAAGSLAVPGSPLALEWVAGLPRYLREMVLEDWSKRSLITPNTALPHGAASARQVVLGE